MKMIWLTAAAAAASVVVMRGPVAAQAAAEEPQASETVEVLAPYVVRTTPSRPRRDANGTYMELIKADRNVSFAGLDLKNPADQAILEARVKQSAQEACAELDRRYPKRIYMPARVDKDCVKTATEEAMVQVRDLIAAAAEN